MGDDGVKGWTVKYFKGLGTSTAAEFKEYFANKKIVDFVYDTNQSDNAIDKVFNKKRANDRKQWLEQYDCNAYLDTNRPSVQYEEFIDNEMIHFSTYDCARSIPNMVDGLKISLRKILFSAFKRKLTSEIKVAQFSGYVSEHSSYHHGEASLNGAIVNMAQNFVGSNNINLLEPNGQFGTRLHGGSDSASERYIFTMLNPLTRHLFPDLDDSVLNYLDDDGTQVEPEYYVPIVPFALVNGISGIGTGFSCSIAPYNPKTIITYLKNMLQNKSTNDIMFTPYYEGFKGTIISLEQNKYLIKGVYEQVDSDKIHIKELPVGTWTMSYISYLETLADGVVNSKTGKKSTPLIRDFSSISTEVNVNILVQFPKGKLEELERNEDEHGCNGVHKLMKLTTTLSTTNMHMFNHERKLRKYENVEQIIREYYDVRLGVYVKRKASLVAAMEKKMLRLSNRALYIQKTLSGEIDLRRKTAQVVTDLLTNLQFDLLDGDYKYLIKMPMDSVTEENVAAIIKERDETRTELEKLKSTTTEKMWLKELSVLETEYDKYKVKRDKLQAATPLTKPKKAVKNTIRIKKTK
jgi:DNA topoisomerase-2